MITILPWRDDERFKDNICHRHSTVSDTCQAFRNGNYFYYKTGQIELSPLTVEATKAERDLMIWPITTAAKCQS